MDGWGGNHLVRGVPVFEVTRHAPPAVPEARTSFTFVTDDVERAVALTRTAAGDQSVYVIGGAGFADALLGAHLFDERSPAHRARLARRPRTAHRRLRRRNRPRAGGVVSEPEVTHLRYRVDR
jgi:hypothetical protein